MKIVDVVAHPLAANFQRRHWTAHERFDRALVILVEVRTDEGLVGIGEITSGPQAAVCEMLELLGPVVKGMDPLAHPEVWQRMLSVTCPRPGGLGGWDGLPPPLPRHQRQQFMAAMAGIDIALWDIKGKAAGMPVFRLLGGTRTDVMCYAVGGCYGEDESPFACVDEITGYVAKGFRAVKLKTGALSHDTEVARTRAVREAIGPDVLLMLDLNAAHDVPRCIQFAHAVTPYDIFWLEEPLHWYLQPADYVRLANVTTIPLAYGERDWHHYSARDFIDSGAIRFIEFDGSRFGGFTESLRVAEYAAQKGVTIAPHVAAHVHAHLVSAFGDSAWGAEWVVSEGMYPIYSRVFEGGVTYRNGRIHLSEEPGFGFNVNWKAVEALKA